MLGHTSPAVAPPAVPGSEPCKPPSREAFHIAIICALSIEANAVAIVLDLEYEASGSIYKKPLFDANTYTTGRIGRHNVVVVHMPGPGLAEGAAVATHLESTFTNISLCLVAGVCGGVPAPLDKANILLGDVIIATTVVQTDMGRQHPEQFSRKTRAEDSLGRANREIRAFLAKLQSEHVHKRLQLKTEESMAELASNTQFPKARYPGRDKHMLYPGDYRHKHRDRPCEFCDRCDTQHDPACDVALQSSCEELGCKAANQGTWDCMDQSLRAPGDEEDMITETVRQELQRINIHFGRIASSNQVMRSGQHRDEIANREEVIGFEMESAGTWEAIPTIVVKAVADYADSHKSKDWQPYSATVAAVCAKVVLEEWRDTDRATDERISPGSVGRVDQEVGRQTVNGNVFYGPIYYG
ncbi:purine and uridine phosphorylase [Aspergillus similis]